MIEMMITLTATMVALIAFDVYVLPHVLSSK